MTFVNESESMSASTNQNYSQTNNSSTVVPAAEWTLEPKFFCAVAVFGLTSNGALLTAFFKDETLRTPFNIFVMHLLVLNIVGSAMQYPFAVIANLYPGTWPLSNGVCSWYLFLHTMINAGCVNTHALIAVNRTWAIVHPISYRNRHSAKLSILIIAGLWAFLMSFNGAYWALDAFWYRLPVESNGCMFNIAAMPVYNAVACLLTYVFPMVIIFVSFPIICARKVVRMKRDRGRRMVDVVGSATSAVKRTNAEAPGQVASTAGSLHAGVAPHDGAPSNASRPGRSREKSGKYLVLMLMTCSVTVCYLPEIIYFLLSIYIPAFYIPLFYKVTSLLYAAQTAVDPILLVCSLEKLRIGVLHLFSL